jgi:hypothetical protein
VRVFQSGQYSQLSQKILNELANARLCLLNGERKAAYDLQLRSSEVVSAAQAPLQSPLAPPQSMPAPPQSPPPPQSVAAPPRSVPPPPRSAVIPPTPSSAVQPPPPGNITLAPGFPAPPVAASYSVESPIELAGQVLSTRGPSFVHHTRRRKSPLAGLLFTLCAIALGLALIVWATNNASKNPDGNSHDGNSYDGGSYKGGGNVTTPREPIRKVKDTPADTPKKSKRSKKRKNRGGAVSIFRLDTNDRIAELGAHCGPACALDLVKQDV